jgi:hypothetical protein
LVSLQGAVPYTSPRKGVQSAWIAGSKTLRLLYCRRRQLLRKAACCSRPSSNSFTLLRSCRAYTQCLASPARACIWGASSDDWFASARACHAKLLAPGSSGTSALVSLRRLVSAGSALVALGPFLSTLVARTGWFWLVRHFRAGLAPPAGLRWFRAGRSRSFLGRACHADRLVLGSSGSSRHWSHSALVSADSARAGPLVSLRSSATGLASPAGLRWFSLGRLVSAGSPRAGWSPLVQLGPRH